MADRCPDRPNDNDGRDETCCLHDLLPGDKWYPGQVCCWCGLIFAPRWEEDGEYHGEYAPKYKKKKGKKR